jgi:hypothetical protein
MIFGLIVSLFLNGILMSFFRGEPKKRNIYLDMPKIIYIFIPLTICLIMIFFGFRFNDTFYISVFYTNIVISIFNLFHFYMKRKRDINMQEKIEKEKKEEEEKNRQRDMKYNLIINCPQCDGAGKHLWFSTRVEITDGTIRKNKWSECLPDDPKAELSKYPYEEDDVYHEAWVDDCPYCRGKGIAYAFFETREVICSKCDGKGKYTEKSRIKEEIGVNWQEMEIKCEKCNGYGKYKAEFVNVHLLTSYERLSKKFYSVELNDKNKRFYSKNKPRFS